MGHGCFSYVSPCARGQTCCFSPWNGELQSFKPLGAFSPSACHESGWARYKKELQRGKTEENWSFNIFLLSDPIPPFLCINSFNNLEKANPETRKPFPNQCHKNPCHLLRNIIMSLNGFNISYFFSFHLIQLSSFFKIDVLKRPVSILKQTKN